MENDANYCTMYIVRHGETVLNVERKLQGHTDSPLTEKGISQVREVAQVLRGVHFDAAFSSDLLRAKRTAEMIRLERNLVIKTTKSLRERYFGSFEGRPYEEYVHEIRALLEEFERLSDEEKRRFKFAPDIESDEEIISRFIIFLREVAVGYKGKTVLVVSHGAMIANLLVHLGFGTYNEMSHGAVSNSAFVKIVSDGVDFFVKETRGIIKRTAVPVNYYQK